MTMGQRNNFLGRHQLARLRTDYVDLYQAHRFDPDVPIEEAIGAFQQVVASGKARYLGFSEWTTDRSWRPWTACGRSPTRPVCRWPSSRWPGCSARP